MQLSQIGDTAMNIAVGTAAIVGAPPQIVDMGTAKATLIALASTVIYKLVISGFQWFSKKINKRKDDDDDSPKMERQALELAP